MKKKEILFVYDSMMIGGTTTSILSLLEALPKDKYNIDLLLYTNDGAFLDQIPTEVNLLHQALGLPKKTSSISKIVISMINGQLFKYFGIVKRNGVKSKKDKRSVLMQLSVQAQVFLSRSLEKKYDVAIGFMELWADAYVASNKVIATKKIAWVHVDYPNSGLVAEIDQQSWAAFQNIVFVSNICMEHFINVFPNQKEKCAVVENLLLQAFVRRRAAEITNYKFERHIINFVTVCRIDFRHKGLDRALNAIAKMKRESDACSFCWYVIGNGPDDVAMKRIIKKEKLDSCVIMVGAQNNPLVIEKKFDAFFLPSRYEGKPMVITEAHMLGLPCIVTEYASAKEQIVDGKDGFIFENSDNGTYNAIKYMVKHSDSLKEMHTAILKNDYSKTTGIDMLTGLLDGRG